PEGGRGHRPLARRRGAGVSRASAHGPSRFAGAPDRARDRRSGRPRPFHLGQQRGRRGRASADLRGLRLPELDLPRPERRRERQYLLLLRLRLMTRLALVSIFVLTARASAAADPPAPSSTVPPAEAPLAAKPDAAQETTITLRAPRARTMDEVSESSTQELHVGGSRARYSLNFFGDVSFSIGHPEAPDHYASFVLGPQNFLLRGELGNHDAATT